MKARDAIKSKLSRLRRGGKPRTLDLFSGCGGLSLGFQSAGFRIVGAVESDSLAAESHALNFHAHCSEEKRAAHAAPRDITAVGPSTLVRELGLGSKAASVDVVIGGPPCQAFARVGRAKLREIAAHPEAFRSDPRRDLYLSFLRYVRELQPVAILMENVPDILNHGGQNIAEEVAATLSDLGYVCRYTLLNAAFYGVPQMRERMFLVAYAHEMKAAVEFPACTHWVDLPRGYTGTRQVALQTVSNGLLGTQTAFVEPPSASRSLRPAVSARQALSDLPPITLHLEGKLKRGARRFDTLTEYPARHRIPSYAALMRKWPSFENDCGVYDHVIRYLPRDYAIFRRMKPGDQYPQAHQLALRMLDEAVQTRSNGNGQIRRSSLAYERLKKEIVPPYDATKFPNKWRKMEADLPARTLMAHIGKDSYSHIHYESGQARTISVREAARLQSFPDGFKFVGTMNPAFRQIGNAVPPLHARALAEVMLSTIRRKRYG